MNTSQLLELLMKVNEKLVKKVGGRLKWDTLSEIERLSLEAECMSEAVLEIGCSLLSA